MRQNGVLLKKLKAHFALFTPVYTFWKIVIASVTFSLIGFIIRSSTNSIIKLIHHLQLQQINYAI